MIKKNLFALSTITVVSVLLLAIIGIVVIKGRNNQFDNQSPIGNSAVTSTPGAANCDDIQEINEKDQCFTNIINNKQNLSISDLPTCDKISEENMRNQCFVNVVLANPQTSVCDSIKDNIRKKNNCYGIVAVSQSELYRCNYTPDNNKTSMNYCYEGASMVNPNEFICDSFSENKDQNYECYEGVAAAKQDLAICDMINDTSKKAWCYETTAEMSNNPEICDKMEGFGALDVANTYCYPIIAKAKQDASICDKITEEWSKYNCIKDIDPSKIKELSVCERIDSNVKYVCYGTVAANNQNLSICDKIPGDFKIDYVSVKDECYAGVAVAKLDLSICDKTSDNWTPGALRSVRGSCYETIAKAKQDSAICEKITDDMSREDCINTTSANKE